MKMEQIYDVLKSWVDPAFVIFVLMLVSFLLWLISSKKKSDTLLLFFVIILFYGLSIFPVSNYLSYQLERDYINRPDKDKINLDVIVVLSGGSYDINPLNNTFPGETTVVRLVHAVKMYKKYGAQYLVCSGKSDSKIPDARLMAQMAEELGVPQNKIRVDIQSDNTYSHALEFNKMFSNKDIKIGLVTSAYHMKRSEKQFHKFFSHVIPLPIGYLYASPAGAAAVRYIPQSQWLLNNSRIFHEYIGELWYSVKSSL